MARRQSTNRVPPLPPEPTDAMPGTVAKIRVMESRVADGYRPHHPLDARDEAMDPGYSAVQCAEWHGWGGEPCDDETTDE